MLKTIVETAANLLYQSFNTITVEQAFIMAIGEYEVANDVDVDLKLTDEIAAMIEAQNN